MDIKQIINGKEYTVCCPDSWYLAKQIASEYHGEYELTYEKTGTAAKISLIQKKKIVDFYDKEHITHIKSNAPPNILGNLYWIGDSLNRVSYSIDENETVCRKKENPDCFLVSYDIFKHLREYDIVEIKATDFHPKIGKDIPMIFRSNKKWIIEHGYTILNTDFGVYCCIQKSVFYRTPNLVKNTKQKRGNKKWTRKNKKS